MKLEKMDAFFASRLDTYDRHMKSNIFGADEFYRFTASLLPSHDGASVLDLGCGTGLELEEYFALNPFADVTGVDLCAEMLSVLKNKFPHHKLTLLHGSYFDLPLGSGRFDAAVSVESLHHFRPRQKQQLYARLHDALKPNGFFVLTDYFAENDAAERDGFAAYEAQKLQDGITDSDFYHFDTPLTVRHEMSLLSEAGFTSVTLQNSWGATSVILARH